MRSYTSVLLLLALLFASACASKPIYLGGSCEKTPYRCAKGLFCIGPEGHRKCKSIRKVAQRCGADIFAVCARGLVCQWRCRIAQGYECTKDPEWCAKDLHCVGTKDYKQCEKPITVGKACLIEPWWVCAAGLTCQGDKCRFKEGEECTYYPTLCAYGLKCAGSDKYKECVKPVKAGGVCGKGLYDVCDHGLKCQGYKCRISKGGDCTYKEGLCAYGLSCVGPSTKKRCELPKKKGDKCSGDYDFCAKGLVCGGLRTARLCIDGADEGRPCRIGNPKMQCEDGLKCVEGFCRYY